MKTAIMYRNVKHTTPPCPNAADRRYFMRRLLDGALALATAVGGIVALIFLFLL